jgi:hypothetical protein
LFDALIFSQSKKRVGLVNSNLMGIKEWFTPQSSEHWPKNFPGEKEKMVPWFIRPGLASSFTPIEGIAHACKTSAEVTKTRQPDKIGRDTKLSTSNRRMVPFSKSLSSTINESN